MTSLLSRRLVTARQLSTRIPSRLYPVVSTQSRFASSKSSPQPVTDDDIASFYSYLESHPSEGQLSAFRRTQKYKDVVHVLKEEGASEADIDAMVLPATTDPSMNGGYVNPPGIKRSQRDPYEDWWDKQERRNYGEPVHEDNDKLGIFSLEEYNVFTTGQAAQGMAWYIASIFSLCGIVYLYYPDKPSIARTWPEGMKAELGGDGTMLAPADVD